jgi:hypothetical protein
MSLDFYVYLLCYQCTLISTAFRRIILKLGKEFMSSFRRLISSRANAARSTGPRTPEGKQRSSQNARRHGCRSRQFVIPQNEQRQEFECLLHSYHASLKPRNQLESACIAQMAASTWRLRTLRNLETSLMNDALDAQSPQLKKADPLARTTAALLGLLDVPRYRALSRYETHESLSFHRALRKFLRLRKRASICTNEATLSFPYADRIRPKCRAPQSRRSARPAADPDPGTSPTASPHRSPTGEAKWRGNHEH